MNTELSGHFIEVRGIAIEIVRKDIKNLHLGVYPPNGRIRVAAPLHLDDDAVRAAVVSRLAWIRKKQAEFEKQVRQSQREFVSGESHYYRGRRYRLQAIEFDGPPSVRLLNNTRMVIRFRPNCDRNAREAVVQLWYRSQLRNQVVSLKTEWERKTGVTVNEIRIKRMKTLWGSCNIEAKRIWLNLELAKKPASCLVFILVHEMVHLIERKHNDRFKALMDEHLPQWRLYRDELNSAPLAHEDWRY
ncbi:MAG: M48 family metallopeptidase [Gemmatimonadetes bacterium]|nr:M48 family metallopeptidase [Gemmatimonadota bacterium]MYD24283.1 M48 family metallopeptidase [Gemmatimonadota bacterium]